MLYLVVGVVVVVLVDVVDVVIDVVVVIDDVEMGPLLGKPLYLYLINIRLSVSS